MPADTAPALRYLLVEQEEIYDALMFWEAARRLQKTPEHRVVAEQKVEQLKRRAAVVNQEIRDFQKDRAALARGESQP